MNRIRLSKLVTVFIFLFPAILALPWTAAASSGPVLVYLNGSQVLFQELPVVEDGNTLVQLRPFYESLGIQLSWDGETGAITGTIGTWEVKMTVGSTEAVVEGKSVTLPAAPRIRNGSTFVPLRFVGESVGGEVKWNSSSNRVDIINDPGYYVYLAALKGDADKVKSLLEQGASANFANRDDGLTTLSMALADKNKDMVEQLLQYGADPNRGLAGLCECGLRPLTMAVVDKDPAIVQLLVDYGADASYRDKGLTALDEARTYRRKSSGADSDKLDQIIAILEKAMENETEALAGGRILVPYNEGERYSLSKGKPGSWGFRGQDGQTAVKPRFAYVGLFSEGLAYAVTMDQRVRGYIDQTGRYRFTFDYKPELGNVDFREGLAAVGKYGKWGYVDTSGALRVPQIYDYARPFSEGYASVMAGEKWGVIDKSGKMVIEPRFENIFSFHHGLALVRGEKSGFINTKGELVISFQASGYSEYGEFTGELAPVVKDGRIGYMNTSGKMIIPPLYEMGQQFYEGLASVKRNGSYGYIDLSGNEAVKPQFEYAFPFRGGHALVKTDGKYRFINRQGQWADETVYDGYDSIMDGGVTAVLYSAFSDYSQGMAVLHAGDRSFYVLPDGKVAGLKQE